MPPAPPEPLRKVLESCLYADDLDAARRFYVDVLGLEFYAHQPGRHLFLRCGEAMVLLFDPWACRSTDGDIPPHGSVGAGHLAFAVADADLPAWVARLQAADIPVERVLEWPGGGKSVYFRDPAGNSLELASPAIWRRPTA